MSDKTQPRPEPEGSHPLWRVLNQLVPVPASDRNGSAFQGWARVMNLGHLNQVDQIRTVARRLIELQEELDRAWKRMDTTPVTADTYADAFTAATRALQVANLVDAWGNIQAHLSPDVLRTLRMCAQLLPDDEGYLSAAARRDLLLQLDAVLEAIEEATDLSTALHDFLVEQVNAMKNAIREYDVRGIRSLRTATYAVEGALNAHFGAHHTNEPASVSMLRQIVVTAKNTVAACAAVVALVVALPPAGEVLAETLLYYRGEAASMPDAGQSRMLPAPARALQAGDAINDQSTNDYEVLDDQRP